MDILSKEIDKNEIAPMVANWICNDYFALLKKQEDDALCIDCDGFAKLLLLLWKKEVTIKNARRILYKLQDTIPNPKDPKEIALELGVLSSNTNDEKLLQIVKDIVWDEKHEKQRNQLLKGGKHVTKMHKFFFGQVMKSTKGVFDPNSIHDVLGDVLDQVK